MKEPMENQISRKEFFKTLFGGFKLPAAEDNTGDRTLRDYHLPPGVKSEAEFLSDCTKCFNCVSVCPHEALRVWREDESEMNGYPVIIPRQQNCMECAERPCITACPTSAMTFEKLSVNHSFAYILRERCLAYQANFCQACIHNCPDSGKAIMSNELAQPVIDEENCSGCGACIYACPAESGAIKLKTKQSKCGEV